jgi:hypothetical protein
MVDDSAIRRFLRSTFGSIWSLELLLELRDRPDHLWTPGELIQALRASEHVLARSIGDLATAGLVIVDEDGRARYAPATPEIERTVADVAAYYAARPGAVRRLIVGSADSVSSFADAFRFRKGEGK